MGGCVLLIIRFWSLLHFEDNECLSCVFHTHVVNVLMSQQAARCRCMPVTKARWASEGQQQVTVIDCGGGGGDQCDVAWLYVPGIQCLSTYINTVCLHAILALLQVIDSRATLEEKWTTAYREHAEPAAGPGGAAATRVPRPSWWGGYKLLPDSFEFWQVSARGGE